MAATFGSAVARAKGERRGRGVGDADLRLLGGRDEFMRQEAVRVGRELQACVAAVTGGGRGGTSAASGDARRDIRTMQDESNRRVGSEGSEGARESNSGPGGMAAPPSAITSQLLREEGGRLYVGCWSLAFDSTERHKLLRIWERNR
jgi:hypothetical protein